MIRLFLGLDLPPDLRERLGALGAGLPGAHWVPEDNLHITLRFIGEVAEHVADDLHDALVGLRAPAFTLDIAGVGTFGGSAAHTLWAGVERAAPLVHLRDKIESALVRAGQKPEGRKFTPHITLAKLRDSSPARLRAFLAAHAPLRAEIEVERFVLFSSHLGAGDPVYRPEFEYGLEGVESYEQPQKLRKVHLRLRL